MQFTILKNINRPLKTSDQIISTVTREFVAYCLPKKKFEKETVTQTYTICRHWQFKN